MKINQNLRNIIIVLALAAALTVIDRGGGTAAFLFALLSLAFLFAIAFVASRLYREHRVAIYSLGDRRRAVVYVAAGVATLTFCASPRLLGTGLGGLAFLLLLAACAGAVFAVFRSARRL
jgi:hypothetical protein